MARFKQTFGRTLNHSRKPNLTPFLWYDREGKVVLLFKTKQDIVKQEEVTFDYGVRRTEDGTKVDWLAGK